MDWRYYDKDNKYKKELDELTEKEAFDKLQSEWNHKYLEIQDNILRLEEVIESTNDKKISLQTKVKLQPLYEQAEVYNKYVCRFCSLNNYELLKRLLKDGSFVSLVEAEKIAKECDENLFCSTDEFHKKEKVYNILTIVGVIFYPTIFLNITLPFIVDLFFRVYFTIKQGYYTTDILDSFLGYLLSGIMLWVYTAPVSVPIAFIFGCAVNPRILAKIIFRKNIPEKIKKDQKKNTIFGCIFGALLAIGLSKANKKTQAIDRE